MTGQPQPTSFEPLLLKAAIGAHGDHGAHGGHGAHGNHGAGTMGPMGPLEPWGQPHWAQAGGRRAETLTYSLFPRSFFCI